MSYSDKFFDIPSFDYDKEKRKLIENIDFLKNMSVEEQTFYKKWYELQSYRDLISNSSTVKAKIWAPTDINDETLTVEEISRLNPTIELVDGKIQESDWLMVRVFCHTMEFSQTPGRFLKFIIHDGNITNRRYLGAISVSSDVISIKDRDLYLGWNGDRLIGNKRINNSAIGSCIMSTQPFGYNFLGGKLAACLVTTSIVRDAWKKLYDAPLVGMTTTSLYGSFSMYNSLKWWHKCGTSSGKIPIKPDDLVYEVWHHWVKENRKEEYDKMMLQKDGVSGPVTGAKQRVIALIFKELGVKYKDYVHGYERGVYYSPFYENTKEFLQDKISESDLKMKDLFKLDKGAILNWWRPKATDRYKKLKSDGKLKSDVLFYNSMIGMDYKSASNLYFGDVGR